MQRLLLLCGVLAGPIYVLVAGVQAFTREGFDLTRHPVSLLSNGDLGWIQITNFVVVGLLVVAAALGLNLMFDSGQASKWGPIMIGIFGVGLVASGVFVADPADGFPPGTPAGDPVDVTFSGIMHFMAGGIAFLALIAACGLFGRRFAASGQKGWATFSVATGAIYLVAFALIAIAPGEAASTILLTVAVVLGWAWLALLSLREMSSATTETDARPAMGS